MILNSHNLFWYDILSLFKCLLNVSWKGLIRIWVALNTPSYLWWDTNFIGYWLFIGVTEHMLFLFHVKMTNFIFIFIHIIIHIIFIFCCYFQLIPKCFTQRKLIHENINPTWRSFKVTLPCLTETQQTSGRGFEACDLKSSLLRCWKQRSPTNALANPVQNLQNYSWALDWIKIWYLLPFYQLHPLVLKRQRIDGPRSPTDRQCLWFDKLKCFQCVLPSFGSINRPHRLVNGDLLWKLS